MSLRTALTTPHTWKLKKVAGPRSMAASIDTRFREHTTARIALRAAERRREQIGQAADTRGTIPLALHVPRAHEDAAKNR